jgi:hypothetical protein
MSKFGLTIFLAAAIIGGWSASAQVRVEILMDQDQFLTGEALPIAVRVVNRSGETLQLGASPDWLTFTVDSRDSVVVKQTGEVPVQGAFTLESSKMGTKRVNLEPYFDLNQPGRYSVVAHLNMKEWGREISSQPKFFTIIEGARLWQADFGVPKSPGSTNEAPEVRRYVLQQVNATRGLLRLYLRVTDTEGLRNFKVAPIGPILSFSRPQPQIDENSNLHLIYQSGPRSCCYTIHNPDGELVLRQFYDITASRPRLKVNEDGKVIVAGGERRVSKQDIPPPPPEEDPMEDDEPSGLTAEPSLSETNAPAINRP